MKELVERSLKGDTVEDSNAGRLTKIRHYIGRLSCHLKSAKVLVAAATRFPTWFSDEISFEFCPSPARATEPPPTDEHTTLNDIANRMFSKNSEHLGPIKEALGFMDMKFRISERMMETYNNPNFLPRVHAELILLEHFYTNKYRFVDGDKYIGCSKPACYCCYHYICEHPGGFVRPACHNKNYLNWRPPDIPDDDPIALEHRRNIINKMVEKIRRDVIAQILEKRGYHNAHHDTTTGIDTSVVDYMASLVLDDRDRESRPLSDCNICTYCRFSDELEPGAV